MSLLRVENLSVNYGSINALREVSFEVNQGEIVSLIGANGAGKTTIMNTVAALKEPSGGAIYFDDKDITRMPSQGRVAAGIVLSPEGRQVFSQFSVRDNLMMGGYLFKNWKRSMICFRDSRREKSSWPARSPAASSRCWPSPVH